MEKNKARKGIKFTSLVYHELLPGVLLFVFPLVFFFRLFIPQTSLFMIPDFGESDVLHFHLPLKNILSQSLKNGVWPLYSNLIGNGFPLLGEGQIGTFYLPNLIFFRFFPVITAYNLNLFIAFLLLNFGMYLFLRKIKNSRISSLVGSLIFTFSGFFAVHLNHFDIIQTASLLPFSALAATYLWRRPSYKTALFLSLILSQQFFSGYVNLMFISLTGVFFLILGYWITNLNKNYPLILKRRIIWILASFCLFLLLSAIQLIPTVNLWKISEKRAGLDFETVTAYPYPFKHLITFFDPYFYGSPQNASYPKFNREWGIFWENTAYLGKISLVFLFLGLFIWRNKIIKLSFFMLFISLLLVLGKNSPLYFLFSFPFFNFFRVPSKFLLLTVFSASIIITIVFDNILKHLSRKNILLAVFFVITTLVFFILDEFSFSYKYPPSTPASWWTEPPPVSRDLSNLKGRILTLGGPSSWNEIFLNRGWEDMREYRHLNNNLYANYNALFDISSSLLNMGGLIPVRQGRINILLEKISTLNEKNEVVLSPFEKNLISLNSIEYLLSHYKINDQNFRLIKEFPASFNQNIIYIYQNKISRPLVYLTDNLKMTVTYQDFIFEVSQRDFLEKSKIIIENDELFKGIDKNDNDYKGEINLVKNTDQLVEVETDNNKGMVLVLSRSYDPNWRAFINGKEGRIFKVNLNQMGISLPAGKVITDLRYISGDFLLGKKITILTGIIISVSFLLWPLTSRLKFSHRN